MRAVLYSVAAAEHDATGVAWAASVCSEYASAFSRYRLRWLRCVGQQLTGWVVVIYWAKSPPLSILGICAVAPAVTSHVKIVPRATTDRTPTTTCLSSGVKLNGESLAVRLLARFADRHAGTMLYGGSLSDATEIDYFVDIAYHSNITYFSVCEWRNHTDALWTVRSSASSTTIFVCGRSWLGTPCPWLTSSFGMLLSVSKTRLLALICPDGCLTSSRFPPSHRPT